MMKSPELVLKYSVISSCLILAALVVTLTFAATTKPDLVQIKLLHEDNDEGVVGRDPEVPQLLIQAPPVSGASEDGKEKSTSTHEESKILPGQSYAYEEQPMPETRMVTPIKSDDDTSIDESDELAYKPVSGVHKLIKDQKNTRAKSLLLNQLKPSQDEVRSYLEARPKSQFQNQGSPHSQSDEYEYSFEDSDEALISNAVQKTGNKNKYFYYLQGYPEIAETDDSLSEEDISAQSKMQKRIRNFWRQAALASKLSSSSEESSEEDTSKSPRSSGSFLNAQPDSSEEDGGEEIGTNRMMSNMAQTEVQGGSVVRYFAYQCDWMRAPDLTSLTSTTRMAFKCFWRPIQLIQDPSPTPTAEN